jgi:hypothetical protein
MADAPVDGRDPEPREQPETVTEQTAGEQTQAAEARSPSPVAPGDAREADEAADAGEQAAEQDAEEPAPDARQAAFDAFAPKVKPAPIPVSEPPEIEPEDEDDEQRPAASGDAAGEAEPRDGEADGEDEDDEDPDEEPTELVDPVSARSAGDEAADDEPRAEDGEDGDDEDGPVEPAPPATEVEETTLIPKVAEPRAGESTTVLPPVSAPTPGMAHRPYTSAPAGYGGRAGRLSWGEPLPPSPAGQPDAQPTQVQPAVPAPDEDPQPTQVQPSVLGVPPQTGTARGYRPPEFHKVDPQRSELPPPQNFKLDRREIDGEQEGPRNLGRRALLAGGGVAVAAAAGLTLAGVIKLPGTTPKIPTVGFAPATNSGASAATQTGTAFLTAWQNGELETAANITDNPSEALAALTWYKKNLGVVGLVLNPNAANSVGWMTFALTTQAGSPMGQWQYQSGFATYSKQVDGYTRWFVQWSPSILYSALKAGHQLKIKKTPASVKGVVDRNGTLIDTTAHPSLASLVNVLTSKAKVTGATDGQQIIMVNAKGEQVATVATLTDPINNGTIASTLDMNVQSAAEAAVTFKPNSAMVAIQPSTGHILAIANHTTSQYYDNALLARVAPGSTFKIITSAALLNKGIVSIDSDAPCPTTLTITNVVLHNSEGEGGDYKYGEDFARSCNNAFSNFYNASGMTSNLLADTAKTYFGLNQKWDIGVGESAQYMTVQENLSGAGLAESLVGQDQIVSCPLAMCSVAATVATGTFKQPIVVPKQTQVTASPLPSSVQSSLKTMMSEVISQSYGTAAGVGFPNNGHFFGKTGTAEVDNGKNNNSWFVVFDDQHDIALCALAIDGGYGASSAAPECLTVFKKLGYA